LFNAFFVDDSESIDKLLKKDIVRFCSILEDEVTKNDDKDLNYRYIYYDFDDYTYNSFRKAYFGIFSVVGDNIYLNENIKREQLVRINSRYDDNIIQALSKTRDQFRDLLYATNNP